MYKSLVSSGGLYPYRCVPIFCTSATLTTYCALARSLQTACTRDLLPQNAPLPRQRLARYVKAPPSTSLANSQSTAATAHSSQHRPHATTYKFFVTCNPGLEEVVARSIEQDVQGAEGVVTGKSGVYFTAKSLAAGYDANLWLRSAIRVLLYLHDGPLEGNNQVYDFFRDAADWTDIIPNGCTFSVDARVHACPDIDSGLHVQVRAKDAICDALRGAGRTKPLPPQDVADVPLYVALHQDHATLYRDMSGWSLHKRGYRTAMHRAALNEAVAAGVLSLADWPRLSAEGARLADPMCGSGTFLLEAALMALNRAPGLYRQQWPFQQWPDYDERTWKQRVQRARQLERRWKGLLLGNDVLEAPLSLAEKDVKHADLQQYIRFRHGHCSTLAFRGPPPDLVVTNPPWGKRLLGQEGIGLQRSKRRGEHRAKGAVQGVRDSELQDVYSALGDWLKDEAAGCTAYILCGNKDASHALHMRSSKKWPITVGGIDCRLLKYEVRARTVKEQEQLVA